MGALRGSFVLPILRWPDELCNIQHELSGIDQIASLWRCDQYREVNLVP